MLSREHMVKLLCVLDHGTAWYSVESGTPYDATYMYDRDQQLVLQVNDKEPENAFYRFFFIARASDAFRIGLNGFGVRIR